MAMIPDRSQAYLGHRNIQNTTRYTALAPDRFKGFRKDKRLRVLICGGRDFTDRTELYAELDRLHAEYCFDTVIASGARGADVLAVEWAQERGIATQVFNVRSGTFGGRAFLLRNARLLAEGRPDLVVAFPGVGTADVVRQAKAAGIWVLTR
jgi:hypothetical protein